MSRVVSAEVVVGNCGDCCVGHTTTADPDSSGAKQSGSRAALRKPITANAIARNVITTVVATSTSRKFRTLTCSRNEAELGRPHRRDDLDPILLDDAFPFPVRHRSRDLHLRMFWIAEADASADTLQLLPPGVAWDEVPADVFKDARHLTHQIFRGRDVEKVRLGGVKIAHRPFPKGALPRQMQIPLRVQRCDICSLSGRLDVGADSPNEAVAGPLRIVGDDPRTECVKLLRAGERSFPPRRRHGPPNARQARFCVEA